MLQRFQKKNCVFVWQLYFQWELDKRNESNEPWGKNYLGTFNVLFNLKNEGKMKLHQTSSAWQCSQNQRQKSVFHSCLKAFTVLEVCDHCKLFHGTQIFPVSAILRASLSNHIIYVLKDSVKWQKKIFYSSYTIWRVHLWLFGNIEAEDTRRASFSAFLSQAPQHTSSIWKLSSV